MTTSGTVRFFWLMTIQVSLNGGTGAEYVSLDGTIDVPAGTTRTALYNHLKSVLREQTGHERFIVMHFSADRDELVPVAVSGGAR